LTVKIVLTRWDIEATSAAQTWSLSKLQDETRKMFELAESCGGEFDGFGAMMPK